MAEVSVEHVVPVPTDGSVAHVVFARVEYREGEPETYVVPLAFATGEAADVVRRDHPAAVVCDARLGAGSNVSEGVVYDALVNPAFGASILRAMTARRRFGHPGNSIFSSTTRAFRRIQRSVDTTVPPAVLDAEQSNTSIRFGNAAILKFFRKFTPGVNPDFEIGRFLTERVRFPNVPPVAAALEYGNGNGNAEEPATLAILSGYVENAGDAWSYSLDAAGRYFEQVLVLPSWDPPARPAAALVDLCGETPPESLASLIGPYLVSARLLGQRTAELHRALASRRDDEAFAPEPFTRLYTRSLYQGIRNTLSPALRLIRNRIDTLPAQAQADAMTIADGESTILQRLAAVTGRRLPALRIRTHGDYHLGQVLYTGSDFIIIDFEGEPARPLGERRIKKSPLRDVAGMLRSFDYASHAALLAKIGTWIGPESLPALEPWASLWSTWVSVAFLEEYLGAVEGTGLVPTDPRDLKALLDLYLIEKAVYEIAYEVNNRPDWARIPLGGLADLLRQE